MFSSVIRRARLFLLVPILLGALAVGLSIHFRGFDETFALWKIKSYGPAFLDLRLITGSAESYARGYDPTLSNPNDPTHRIFNYPKVWYLILGSGITDSWAVPLGIAIVGLFLASVWLFPGKLTPLTTCLILLALASPAVMLAIDRCNVDLIFFVTMTLSLLLLPGYAFGSFAILLVSILFKIIPVLGIGYFMDRESNRSLKFILGGILFTALYFVLTLKDMVFIFRSTQKGVEAAYGLAVLPQIVTPLARLRRIREGPAVFFQFLSALSHLFLRFRYAPYVAALLLLGVATYLGLRFRDRVQAGDLRNLRAFWMGAGMYIGTFFIGNNWEYRLIFLLFTLPQLVEWVARADRKTRAAAIFTLVVLFWSLWHQTIQTIMTDTMSFGLYYSSLVDQAANWALFTALAYFFAFSLPNWIFEDARSLFAKILRALQRWRKRTENADSMLG